MKSQSARHEKATTSKEKVSPVRRKSFSGEFRIKTQQDFARLRKVGRKLHCKHMLLLISDSPTNNSRLGLIVTKKVDKRAVGRNLFKRRIREIFRLNREMLSSNIDIVVIARSDSVKQEYQELERQFLSALSRAGLLHKSKAT